VLQLQFKSFTRLYQIVTNDPNQDQALRDLKTAVANAVFPKSPEQDVVTILRKILKADPDRRRQLKICFGFGEVYGRFQGGVGDLMGSFGQATNLSVDTPIQTILHDTLVDDDLMGHLMPILWKITNDKNFLRR